MTINAIATPIGRVFIGRPISLVRVSLLRFLREEFGTMRSGRIDQTSYWCDAVAAWKHVGDERAIIGSQMVFEHALEHGTHVSGRGEVAVLQQIGRVQTGPVGDHPPSLESAAG